MPFSFNLSQPITCLFLPSRWIIVLFILNLCTFSAASNIIQDLDRTNYADFSVQTSSWTVDGGGTLSPLPCGGSVIYGGFTAPYHPLFAEKSFNIGPSHTSLTISFDLWLLSGWTPSNTLSGFIRDANSNNIFNNDCLKLNQGSTAWSSTITCGQSTYPFALVHVIFQIPHNQNVVLIGFWQPSSPANVVGIRNITIVPSNNSVATASYCNIADPPNIISAASLCTCTGGQYLDMLYGCLSCDSSCQTCSGPSSTQCSSCSSDMFLYDNRSCLATCPRFINYTQGVQNYCHNPCYNTTSFLYANHLCFNNCSPLFTSVNENGYLYCDSPCSLDQFTAADGSCVVECDDCFLSGLQGAYKTCLYPDLSSIYQTASPSCIEKTCSAVLKSSSLVDETDNIAFCRSRRTDPPPSMVDSVAGSALLVSSVLLMSNPSTITSSAVVKLLQYSRYMNIESYSYPLLAMFSQTPATAGFLPFMPAMTDNMKSKFPKMMLPIYFEYYRLHSSFLVNIWRGLLSILACCGICIVLLVVECFAKTLQKQKLHSLLQQIRMPAVSFLLVQIHLIFGDVVLFFILQTMSTPLDSPPSIASFFIALILIVICASVMSSHLYLILEYQTVKRESNQPQGTLEAFSASRKNTPILFSTYKDGSMLRQGFLLIFTVRLVLVNIIIGALYSYPLVQVILMLVLNIGMIIYILCTAPFKSPIDFIQQLSIEVILLIVDASILVLAVLDEDSTTSRDTENKMSRVVIVCNQIVKPLPLVIVGLHIGLMAYNYFKMRRVNKRELRAVVSVTLEPVDQSTSVNTHLNLNKSCQEADLSIDTKPQRLRQKSKANRDKAMLKPVENNLMYSRQDVPKILTTQNISLDGSNPTVVGDGSHATNHDRILITNLES